MNQTFVRACAPAALLGLLLAGCSGAQSSLPTTSAVPDSSLASPAKKAADSVVWVTNFTNVTSYDVKSGKLLSTLFTDTKAPLSIVFDYNGNMFVGNQAGGLHSQGEIIEFAPGGTAPILTIEHGIDDPFSLAVDYSNNIYCANQFSNSVTVYAPGKTKPSRTITDGVTVPVVVLIDPAGNLYVANTSVTGGKGSVTEYAPGGSTPTRTITTGVNVPLSLALDKKGNLFVGNYFGKNVSEYAPGSTAPLQVFGKGLVPAAITTDAKGNLYDAAYGKKGVYEYATRDGSVIRTITEGINFPRSLSIAPGGQLVVANYGEYNEAGSVTTYAAGGATKMLRQITKSIVSPKILAFPPVVSIGG